MIYTIGHSTRPIELLIELLNGYGIRQVIDIRSIPYSTYNPQYNKEKLAASLESVGINYIHMKALGGFRKPKKDSINLGWANTSFRGFADYMQTDDFTKALTSLIDISHVKNTALLCSEAVPWRCHRSLIADALTIRKIGVIHILEKKSSKKHKLTPFAKITDGTITYPKTVGWSKVIKYKYSHGMKILFVGINPHYGSFRRGIPFSNNKMFWYLLNSAHVIDEKIDDLKDDGKLRVIYNKKFNPLYKLGFVNIINKPTRDVSQLTRGEENVGRKRIMRIVREYRPKIVCFIGKITYEKFANSKNFDFGWQQNLFNSRVYIMHFPIRGKASVRIRELEKLINSTNV